jgi:hypothetical protein
MFGNFHLFGSRQVLGEFCLPIPKLALHCLSNTVIKLLTDKILAQETSFDFCLFEELMQFGVLEICFGKQMQY